MLADERFRIAEIRLVVRAKVKPRALSCPPGCGGQEVRLHDAVFVMAALGPRVGKEEIDRGKAGAGRQGIEKIAGIGLDELEIFELSTIAFPQPAIDPIFADIDPDAYLGRMGGSVSRQKVAMSTADFPDKRSLGWNGLSNNIS